VGARNATLAARSDGHLSPTPRPNLEFPPPPRTLPVRIQAYSQSGCLLVTGRSPNRTTCDPPIRQRCTPNPFPSNPGTSPRGSLLVSNAPWPIV
jgi:hypothetical protein